MVEPEEKANYSVEGEGKAISPYYIQNIAWKPNGVFCKTFAWNDCVAQSLLKLPFTLQYHLTQTWCHAAG